MNMEVLSKVVTLGVFSAIGWSIAQRWRLPIGPRTSVLLLLVIFVGAFVGTDTNVICLNGIGVCISLKWAITSCCLGIVAGHVLRTPVPRQNGPA